MSFTQILTQRNTKLWNTLRHLQMRNILSTDLQTVLHPPEQFRWIESIWNKKEKQTIDWGSDLHCQYFKTGSNSILMKDFKMEWSSPARKISYGIKPPEGTSTQLPLPQQMRIFRRFPARSLLLQRCPSNEAELHVFTSIGNNGFRKNATAENASTATEYALIVYGKCEYAWQPRKMRLTKCEYSRQPWNGRVCSVYA